MGTKGTFERIFWLDDFVDDASNGIDWIQVVPFSISLADVVRRITFAFDLATAKEVVQKHPFDLYILDADFPDRLPPARAKMLEEYVDALRGSCIPGNEELPLWKESDLPIIGEAARQIVGCNFRHLYRNHLWERGARVVVYSKSDNAAGVACSLGLPFYTKTLNQVDWIKAQALAWGRRASKDLSVENWECGTPRELGERYLVL